MSSMKTFKACTAEVKRTSTLYQVFQMWVLVRQDTNFRPYNEAEGVSMDSGKFEVILDWQRFKIVNKVQSFLA